MENYRITNFKEPPYKRRKTMISVKRYKEEHINDTKEELVAERKRLLEYIEEYECRYIFGDEKDNHSYKPSKYAIYKTHHLYLSAICELLFERT